MARHTKSRQRFRKPPRRSPAPVEVQNNAGITAIRTRLELDMRKTSDERIADMCQMLDMSSEEYMKCFYAYP